MNISLKELKSACVLSLLLAACVATAAALPAVRQTFFVPFPEADFQTSLKAIDTTGTAVGNQIKSTISIVVPTAGTIIVYDHWEDGYEADPSNPTQSSTQIWGDGNPAHGQPPGYPSNILPAGAVIKLQNVVNLPRSAGTIAYDGRDRLTATSAIAVTRAAWGVSPGTVLCSASEVYDTRKYGKAFRIPVGTNVGSSQQFEYSCLHIIASQDNTTVQVDVDGNGTIDTTKNLNMGESMFVNGGVKAGAAVTSNYPVQVQELTGDIGSTYESRTFAIRPTSLWGSSYYAPVGTTLASETHNIFLYNPNAAAITVTYETTSSNGTFIVPANGNYQYTMPMNSGARFYTAGNETFYAVGANDSGAGATSNQTHDWGYALLPENFLTTGVIVPWGPGSDTTGTNTNPDQNGSPVWVTPTANTTVYVNYSGNLASGPNTAPNGAKYNIAYSVSKWQSIQIYDTTDRDMTGARIFTTDGTRLASAWGEDPAKAGPGSPYLDLGTTIVPFPQPSLLKIAKLVVDVNGNGQVDTGDTIQYTIRVSNEGVVDLDNTIVIDSLPSSLTYVPGSTKVNAVAVTDNLVPATAFPVDESGYALDSIPPGAYSEVIFRATVNPGATTITNVVGTSVGGQSFTTSATTTVPSSVTPPTVTFTDSGGTTVSTYPANGGIYLTLTDSAANTSATTVQTVSVLVKNPTTGDMESVTLTETGINTGIFTSSAPLPSSTSSGSGLQDGTLYALAGNGLVASYTNSVTGLSCTANASIFATIPVKKLYLSDPSQALDRVDPVASGDLTTASSASLAAPSSSTIAVGGTTTKGSSGSGVAVTSLTFSHTPGSGSNRLLIVAVSTGSPDNVATQGTVSNVTFNGNAMTLVGSAIDGVGTNANSYIYMMKDASLGTTAAANVVITATNSTVLASATTFTGVNQTTPLGTFASANSSVAGATVSLTSAYASAAGELVYSVGGIEQGNTNRTITTASGQAELSNTSNNKYIDTATSTIPGAASVSPTYTASANRNWTIGVVAIKPAPGSSGGSTTFTQAPAMAKPFTTPAIGTIGLTTYVSGITGSMPANPAVTAVLKKGTTYAGASTFATFTSPAFTAGTGATGNLVWSGSPVADTTVAVGEFIYLDIINKQSGVSFAVDYDSSTKPSAISLPANTVITVDSLGIYDAPYPGGTLISGVNNGQKAYVRVTTSDPFGAYDITSLDVTLTNPSGGTSSTNLTSTVATTASSKTYEYAWTSGPATGGYSITVKANEGTEGINATSTTPLQVTQQDLGTPSTTTFTDSSGNPVTSYTTSGPAYVQVIDQDKNTDPLTVQTIIAVITTSTGDRETVTLTETGPNTGIFRSSSITVNTGSVTQGNNALNIVPGASLLVTYVDAVDSSDTSSANAVIVTASTTSVSIYKSLISPSSGKALLNDAISYNIQIANTGSNSLPTVSVSDSFDNARLQYVGASIAPSSTGTGTLNWTNVGPLAAGQIVNIQVNFTALAVGTAANSASAGGTASSGPSTVNVTIDKPKVTVTKTLLNPVTGPSYKGDNVTFRIVVQNTGTTSITTLPLSDNFSGRSFQFVSATIPPDSSGSGSLLWNNLGPLAVNASKTIDVTMLVNGAAAPADNTADISYAVDAGGNPLPPVSSTASITTLAGSIGSTIFQDKNNNGLPDSGEGIADVTVFADLNNNGVRDSGEPFSVTDSTGTYQLYNLALDTYKVMVDTTTLPTALTKLVADPDGVKDGKTSVTLTAASLSNTSTNFGYQYPSLSGNVYDDANGLSDGIVNGTGTNAGGTLYANLINSSNLVVKSVAVGSGGTYSFPNVTPNGYTVVISTTSGTVGAAASAVALPLSWVNTGEFLGSGAGDDGTVNGSLAVTVAASDVTNANFGIDQRPVPNTVTASPVNPGGTTQVVVPTLSGTDPEGSPVTTMIIKTLPANATLYYNGVAVAAGQTITNYNSSLLTVDPVGNGATTVIFNYSVVDAANVESSTTALVTLSFTPGAGKVSIAGNVYDDANGLLGTPVNTVDGTGTSAGGLLYANLINSSNNVSEVVLVASDGSYSFGSVASSGSTSNYSVVLSTIAGTVGAAKPAASLPSGWVNTGEFLGSGAGSDGTVNGTLAVSISNTNVNNANFGIDRLPSATALSVPAQPNPNLVSGTAKVTIPSLGGTDPEDATIGTIIIKTLPSGTGTLFYNGVAVTANQTISSYNPSLLTVQPATGTPTVTFTYSVVDAAGKESAASATVTMPFTGISVSGKVFDDANGLTDGIVNGSGTNTGSTLYAYLVNGSNNVLQVATVAADGSYIFSNAVTANTSYTVVLSTTSVTVGSAAPAAVLPSGWVNTGEFFGSGAGSDGTVNGILPVSVTTTSVANVNFGVDRKPTAATVTAPAQFNPGSNTKVQVPALSGTDPEDTTTGAVVIKTLPSNGTLYYNGVAVTAGQVITSYNPLLLAVDPNDGAITVSFTYSVQDAAGVESAAATVTMPFTDIVITGTVFNDANGLLGSPANTVDGAGTNAGGTVYASLVDGTNKVVQSVLVSADGTYTFTKVAPNTSYSVVLGTELGILGALASPAATPSGFVSTGENIGSGAGSDGTPDGVLAVVVATNNLANANFGIERTPSANVVTAATQANPGGTAKVVVPALNGTDPEDASVTVFVIKTLPSNGTLYYNGTAVTSGQKISGYDPSLLKVDPNDGSVTVSFTYAAVDAAGKESGPVSVSMPFTAVNISGNVYDDVNGLLGTPLDTVDGTGTNVGGTLYVNLIDGGNQVVQAVAVAADGTYSFGTVAPNASYTIVLSTTQGSVGAAAPAAALPSGYRNTGEHFGAGAGSDGTPNGILAVTVTTASVGNANFGIQQLGTITGSVLADTDNNNTGDSALVGVNLELRDATTNALIASTTTNGSGAYSFGNVAPGSYKIVETQPSGYNSVSDKDGGNLDIIGDITPVVVTAGATNSGNNFVEEQPGSISGSVLADTDGNGSGDAPLTGVLVRLLNSGGSPVLDGGGSPITTTTAPDGSYSFGGLPPGNYRVAETQPSNYNSVSDKDGGNLDVIGDVTLIAVSAGASNSGNTFVEVQLGVISGHVYADSDNNGSGDAPLSGVLLTLLDSSGNPVDGDPNTPGVQPRTTTTNGSGAYSFTGVAPGSYRVSETQPSGYASVSDVDGANNNLIGDQTPIVVTPGLTVGGRDFVEIQYGSIAGSVHKDSDNNGSGDAPLGGVTLNLLDSSGNPVDGDPNTPGVQPVTTTTAPDGTYTFNNVLPGSYQVAETQPSGYGSVSDVDGGNPDLIGNTTPITVAPGQAVTGRDFVDIQLGSITGFVFVGSSPLAGVTLTLLDSSGNPVDGDPNTPGVQPLTTTTASDGSYTFSNVTPGSYKVAQTQPFGYNSFGDKDGGDLDVIGDVSPITVLPGQTNAANNFIESLDTCPDTWAEWKFQHPGETAAGNPDADAYDNFAEFAFAMPYDNGTGSPWLGNTAWIIRPSALAPGTLEGAFIRPKGALQNVTCSLQYAATATNPTVWQTLVITPLMISTVDNGDCTETVTIHDLETLTGLTGGSGVVRIKADLDEDPPTGTDHTSYTEVEGWKETPLVANCATYNNPFLREAVFTGTVGTVSGQDLAFTISGGGADLSTLLTGGTYYLEVTSGDNVGHRFDIASATGNTITLANDTSLNDAAPPFNTLTGAPPANLAGDQVVVRRHWTLNEVFPPSGFGASGDQSTADEVQVFAGGAWTIYWLYDENDGNPATARWVDAADAGMADQGAVIIQPGQGMFFNNRNAVTSILAYGEVRANAFIRPLAAGANLVGGGYPLDQSATGNGSRAMSLATGFFGSRDFKTADLFSIWRADSTNGATGYDSYYLLNGAPTQSSILRWVKVGDTSILARDAETLLLGNRSAFLRSKTGLPGYTTPLPWSP